MKQAMMYGALIDFEKKNNDLLPPKSCVNTNSYEFIIASAQIIISFAVAFKKHFKFSS